MVIDPHCEKGHCYLLNNYHPGYFSKQHKKAGADISSGLFTGAGSNTVSTNLRFACRVLFADGGLNLLPYTIRRVLNGQELPRRLGNRF